MTIPAPDKIPYDPWFDYKIPSAIYDTLQCWIATENTSEWTTKVDNNIPVSYTHQTLPTTPYV